VSNRSGAIDLASPIAFLAMTLAVLAQLQRNDHDG
jgi:hypothetical protein